MSTATTTMLVCNGKHCRTAKGYADIVDMGLENGESQQVTCQGICHGPVVGLRTDGDVRWFEKLRGGKQRARLGKSLLRGKPTKALRAREVRKRRGVIRHIERMKRLRKA